MAILLAIAQLALWVFVVAMFYRFVVAVEGIARNYDMSLLDARRERTRKGGAIGREPEETLPPDGGSYA